MKYEAVIGLEIHAELNTRTKMFCASLNDPDEIHPNVNVCPICMGHPGTLPVPNQEAIEKTIKVGLALNGEVSTFSQFDRKNYFYPDLPKGYQVSQYAHPLVSGGYLEIDVATPNLNQETTVKRVRIRRIHLEEDTGRLLHDDKTKSTLIDFNRAGVPLLELVTEPDMSSGGEVKKFGEELQRLLRYLDASEVEMEKGEMRVEVNISLSNPSRITDSEKSLGTKVEIKNINSFKFAADAVDFEVKRQSELLDGGMKIKQETRGWDEKKGTSFAQRLKEESQDYRYFPEPDIPPLSITPSQIEELKRSLPELPAAKLTRFRDEFGISASIAEAIVQDKRTAAFFEAVASELENRIKEEGGTTAERRPLQLAANYLTTDLAKLLSDSGTPIHETLITPENFAELVTYIYEAKISSRVAKEVLKEMFASGVDPSNIIGERKLWQISESSGIAEAVEKVLKADPKAAEDYKSGKTQVLQFLVGQVMKETEGANPEAVRMLLKEKLK